jgi:hypothetical protein
MPGLGGPEREALPLASREDGFISNRRPAIGHDTAYRDNVPTVLASNPEGNRSSAKAGYSDRNIHPDKDRCHTNGRRHSVRDILSLHIRWQLE